MNGERFYYAKRANPPLRYASAGNGSQHHLTMERLKARAGFDMLHVPYRGGVPATTATVAGEVAAMMSGTSTAAQIRAGRLRALAEIRDKLKNAGGIESRITTPEEFAGVIRDEHAKYGKLVRQIDAKLD